MMIDAQPKQPRPNPATEPPLRVALAHDWLVARRGGELVLDAIARLLAQDGRQITRLYTMFDRGRPVTPAIDLLDRVASPLSRMPPQLRRWLLMRYPAAVRDLTRRLAQDHASQPVDLLISTHSAAIKAIKPPPAVPHLCYCHTPARYLWSQTDAYARGGAKAALRRLGLAAFAPSLRRWDRASAENVTHFLANSSHTADQIRRHYQRESTVIHPPVRTAFFTPADAPRQITLLLVSALEPYKRVELAIDAACIAKRPLTIVGSGSHEGALRRHARRTQVRHGLTSHIAFAGVLSDEALRDEYRRAGAFLFPQIEDFGITAVEAQAAGCPVVARRAGGALDSVVEDQTGAFFDEPRPQAIAQAIDRATDACPPSADTARRCRDNALRFSEDVFENAMRDAITRALH